MAQFGKINVNTIVKRDYIPSPSAAVETVHVRRRSSSTHGGRRSVGGGGADLASHVRRDVGTRLRGLLLVAQAQTAHVQLIGHIDVALVR